MYFFPTHTLTRPHHLLNLPAHEDLAPHCSVAGKGVGVVDGPQDAAAVEKGWVTDGEALGTGLEDGNLGALLTRDQAQALWEVAGYRVGTPEEEPDGGSSHPGGLAMGHGGSEGGGDDGVHWGGDGGGCCCHCSGGGCCGRGGGGESDGLYGHVGVSLEG